MNNDSTMRFIDKVKMSQDAQHKPSNYQCCFCAIFYDNCESHTIKRKKFRAPYPGAKPARVIG